MCDPVHRRRLQLFLQEAFVVLQFADLIFLSDQRAQFADSGVIFQFTIQEVEEGRFAITEPCYVPTYVWRTEVEGETTKYRYRTLAVGQWLDQTPEGMSDTDAARMRQVWQEAEAIIPADIATAIAE